MGRSMADPNYVHRPWSPEHRERLRLIQRRRLGIPDGCAQLYGLHVPLAYAEAVRTDAVWIANTLGWPKAQEFILAVPKIDWSLVDELYEEHTDYRQLAEHCGVPSWYIEKRTRHLRRINPRNYTEPRRECE